MIRDYGYVKKDCKRGSSICYNNLCCFAYKTIYCNTNSSKWSLNRLSYKFGSINRFDIVVVDKGDSYIIKRVIGLPGENIRYEDNKLYVNDELIEEPFLEIGKNTDDFEASLPDDCYFLMGDNRQVSLDSRALGCFDISKIRGKTSFSFFPFNRFGFKS